MSARLRGITVPTGFTIPFFYYDQFIKENKLDDADLRDDGRPEVRPRPGLPARASDGDARSVFSRAR